MTAQLINGWIVTPYNGHDASVVEFGIEGIWFPAFLSYTGSTRVAQIRPPQGVELKRGQQVQVRVDGSVVKTEEYTG